MRWRPIIGGLVVVKNKTMEFHWWSRLPASSPRSGAICQSELAIIQLVGDNNNSGRLAAMVMRLEKGFLPAARAVLGRSDQPLSCQEITKRAISMRLLKSEGKTPHRTLYAMLTRNIKTHGARSEFRKSGAGLFTLARKN